MIKTKEGLSPFLSASMIFRTCKIEFLRREELVQREFDGVKDVARILICGSSAFLVGVAEIEGRNQKLNKAHKLYDREYTQSDHNSSLRSYQSIYLASVIIASAMVVFIMYPFDAGIQNQGLGNLNLDDREIILLYQPSAAIVAAFAGQRQRLVHIHTPEDLDFSFRSKENYGL